MDQQGRIGAWLFRNRGWLPVPLFGLCLVPVPQIRAGGVVLIVLGEAVRFFAVGHIGRRSRTRDETVGSLVDSGPYARLRNPLYVGNVCIWAGFGVLAWPAVVVVVPLLMWHYHHIVRWEEQNLLGKIGAPYADYLLRVPRWLPLGAGAQGRYDFSEALRSERGTFLVLTLMSAAMAVRWYLGG